MPVDPAAIPACSQPSTAQAPRDSYARGGIAAGIVNFCLFAHNLWRLTPKDRQPEKVQTESPIRGVGRSRHAIEFGERGAGPIGIA
jgi:hypothetical protein